MGKCIERSCEYWLTVLLVAFCIPTHMCAASDLERPTYSVLAESRLKRAEQELARMEQLVQDGTAPRNRLLEAQSQLEDARDQATLAGTLYSSTPIAEFTADQVKDMLSATERRVQRQSILVEDRRKLLDSGILAPAEFERIATELELRKQVLSLATSRADLFHQLKTMAETERQLEHASQNATAAINDAMLRYRGNGLFSLGDLTTISAQYEKHFGRALPVSAMGQTLLHQSLGLDHRNRVDVALNPDGPEGLWLRQLLEKLHIPYLGFRSAVAGAATAPHIHIGIGSTRLKLASR